MRLTTDELIFWQYDFIHINATMIFTWLVMLLMVLLSFFATRKLKSTAPISPWQNLLEVLVGGIKNQIEEISQQSPGKFLPFIGSLFLFIAVANLLAVIPGYLPPTGSLSTTTALAICVFIAVPLYGINEFGVFNYLRQYLQPTVFMLPFNLIGELSRTLALAVRLYGNIMSSGIITAILLSIAPFLFPVIMQLLGLLTGMIQAYIFAVLAMVYIASSSKAHEATTINKHNKIRSQHE